MMDFICSRPSLEFYLLKWGEASLIGYMYYWIYYLLVLLRKLSKKLHWNYVCLFYL